MKTLLLICCLVLNTSVYAAGKDDCKPDGVLQTILSLLSFNKNPVKLKPAEDAGPIIQSWIQSWKINAGKEFSFEEMKPFFDSVKKELNELATMSTDPGIRRSARSILKTLDAYKPDPMKSHLETEVLTKLVVDVAEVFREAYPLGAGSRISMFESRAKLNEGIASLRVQGILKYYRFTDKKLAIRNINDLSPYPIYAVGVSKKPMFADTIEYSAVGGIAHDLGHGSLNATGKDSEVLGLLNMGKVDAANEVIARQEKIYQGFRRIVDKVPTQKQKEILELLWFETFHERSARMTREIFSSGDLGFGNKESLIKRVMRRLKEPNDYELNFTIPVDSISAKDISDALVRLTKLGVE